MQTQDRKFTGNDTSLIAVLNQLAKSDLTYFKKQQEKRNDS